MEEIVRLNKEENKVGGKVSEKEKDAKQTGLLINTEKDETKLLTSVNNTLKISAPPLDNEEVLPGKKKDEEIKEPVFDRKVSDVEVPAEGEELLLNAPPKFGDLMEAGDPALSIQGAGQAVLNDVSRRNDSFEMESVKREIGKLNSLLAENASPITLLRQYDWLIYLCDERYLAGKRANSSYHERHEKVRTFLRHCRAQRQKLLQKHPNAEGEAYLKEERQENRDAALAIMKGNSAMKEHSDALVAALSSYLPMTAEGFSAAQQKLLRAYDALIADYQKEAGASCIRKSAKVTRENAQRILLQLRKEKSLFASYTFDAKAKSRRRTWKDGLTTEKVRNVTDQKLQQKGQIYQKADQGQELSRMFADIIGASSYYVPKEKVHHTGKNEDGYAIAGNMASLTEAMARADSMGVDLIYSPDAAGMLNIIQIIDMIMGVTKRSDQDIKVAASLQSIENKQYLVITDVQVLDTAASFGKEKFDELNVQAQDGSKKQLVDADGKLLTGVYSVAVANRILALDPDLMKNYFTAAGLSRENTDAFLDRLGRIKAALKTDKDTGIRHHFTSISGKMDQAATEKDQKRYLWEYGEYIRTTLEKNCDHTYVNKTLLQDNGIVDGEGMEKINRTVDGDLKTQQKSARGKKIVAEYVRQARLERYGADALDPKTEAVLSALENYTDITFTGQGVSYLGDRYGLHYYVKNMAVDYYREAENEAKAELKASLTAARQLPADGEVPQGQLEEAVRKKLKEKYTNVHEFFLHVEAERFSKAKRLLEERKAELTALPQMTDAEKAELQGLKSYEKLLFSDSSGRLQVPGGAKIRRLNDTGITEVAKWLDRTDRPLFVHPPCVSDVNQGNVGDCYFVASLAAATESEPDFIQNHMKDNGDGTVTVLFYEPESEKREDAKKLYVTVKKSIAANAEGNNIGATGALWVQLYEKAFLASGLANKRYFTKYRYSDISGGNTNFALGWITGKKGVDIFESNGDSGPGGSYETKAPSSWFTRDQNGVTQYSDRFRARVQQVKDTIKEALKQKKMITASSFHHFDETTGLGPSGEHKRRGLATSHVYTILGMETIDGKDYVRIRNPWGSGVVETVKNERTGRTTIRKTDSLRKLGTFLLDFETFTEHFRRGTAA